jgi:hypothetical protein
VFRLSSYTASSAGYIPAGSYTLALNGQSTFTSSLGYAINVSTGSSTLTVQPKAINVSGLSANGKVYDGTSSTTVSATAGVVGGGASSGDGKFSRQRRRGQQLPAEPGGRHADGGACAADGDRRRPAQDRGRTRPAAERPRRHCPTAQVPNCVTAPAPAC